MRPRVRHPRLAVTFILVASAYSLGAAPAGAQVRSDPPEIRALWIDAFHPSIRSMAEAEAVVAAATRANLNTLFVQVRRRGDALYLKGVEPPVEDSAYDPAFDGLDAIVGLAHRAGLQVHAWINAMPAWRDQAPPKDPRHVFNRHGPTRRGDDNWFTASPTGDHRFPVGYFLDPGHPAAADYLVRIYLDIVRNYGVDGIHFDYIRYPETDERLARGAGVGYNAVSLARFRRATRRTDTPAPGDEQWTAWRRKQVTHLVRRIAIEARAISPRIKVSAALIPWGAPPTNERDFNEAAPMQRIFQDWHAWLRDGLLDLGVPMNYARETDDRVRAWFDGWLAWQKRHKHGRQVAAGLGAYRNTPEDTLAQVARARRPEKGHRLDGVSFFSYAAPRNPPNPSPNVDPPSAPDPGAAASDRLAYLADGIGAVPAAFANPAPVPPMPWIDRPTHGTIIGAVQAPPGEGDGAIVKVKRAGLNLFARTRTLEADGNGVFGLTLVKPGRYRVRVERGGQVVATTEARVTAGHVTRADVQLEMAAGR